MTWRYNKPETSLHHANKSTLKFQSTLILEKYISFLHHLNWQSVITYILSVVWGKLGINIA